jgi:DNA-binding CsgD family transcriptional regulator
MGKALVEEGGCIKLYDLRRTKDGISSVYYFGMEQALKRPTTGLGVIFANIWGFAGDRDRFPLELTEKEREVLMLRLGGCSYKEVAEILGISAYALEGRMKRIDQKAKKLGLQDRKSILAYAAHQ